jgi:hypothetical protein
MPQCSGSQDTRDDDRKVVEDATAVLKIKRTEYTLQQG